MSYLLLQRVLGILVIFALAGLELGDAGLLLLELFVIGAFFFDEAGEGGSCYGELGGGGHDWCDIRPMLA